MIDPNLRLRQRNAYQFFRQAWSPRAAYHLMRVRHGEAWEDRFISGVWLMQRCIPFSGGAPSMQFKGLPL